MTPCEVWSRWTYPLPSFIACLLLIYYFMLWPRNLWSLTLNIWTLNIACDVMKLCTKFERNRAICGEVIAISIVDLMTLNKMCYVLRARLCDNNFHHVWPWQLIRAWIIAFFDANMLCHAVTLTFDPLTLKVRAWYIKRHVIKVFTKFRRWIDEKERKKSSSWIKLKAFLTNVRRPNIGHYTVQGHSMSPILVPIKSPYD